MNINGGLIWQKLSGKVEESRKDAKGEADEANKDNTTVKGRRRLF
jgi:hypothetical protein